MEFTIEKNVPFPSRTRNTWVPLAESMGVGDSVEIPVKNRGSLVTVLVRAGFKAVTKASDKDGFVRVWKTKP